MGAGVSSLYAGVCPERVDRLVLLEGIGPLTNPEEMARNQMARSILWKGGKERRVYGTLEEAASRRVGGPAQLSLEAAITITQRGVQDFLEGLRISHDPRHRAPSRMRLTEEMTLTYLREIVCPTLYVQALGGWPLPEDFLNSRLAAVPDLEMVSVEGHHHVHLEHPERVIGAIQALLGKPIASVEEGSMAK